MYLPNDNDFWYTVEYYSAVAVCIYIYVKMLFKLCPGLKKKVVGKFVKDERKCTVKTKDAKLVVHVILNFAIFVIRNKILCFIYLLIKVWEDITLLSKIVNFMDFIPQSFCIYRFHIPTIEWDSWIFTTEIKQTKQEQS